jgi:2-methylcitrate dehydratase PrpD
VAALAVHGGHAMGEALRAIIIGYEVGARLGAVLRIRPGMHVDAGWPALGVAAAVVALAGGSPVRARDAIEIAASQLPFGLYLPVAQGADARNTYLGHAASLGIQAAQSALAGVQAPRGALGQHADLALGMDGTSAFIAADRWLLAEGYLKAWPAVRHVHYGIAAALALRPRLAGGPDAIRQVRLRIYPEATVYCGNRSPVTPIQAQFSLSFGLAAALCEGALEPASYLAPRFDDPALRRIEAMIEIEAVTTFGDQGSRIAELTIETTDGLHHVERIEQISGDPSMPFDASSTRAKFVDYASPTLGEHAGPLADRWLAMAHAAPVSEWWKQVCSSLPE